MGNSLLRGASSNCLLTSGRARSVSRDWGLKGRFDKNQEVYRGVGPKNGEFYGNGHGQVKGNWVT